MSADGGHPPGLRSPVVRHPSQALAAHSVADVLGRLAAIAKAFERACRQMVQAVMQRRLPTTLCTIPYPRFPEPELQRLAVTALTVFNDASIQEAFKAGIPLLDLRLICDAAAAYANPIEPPMAAGPKIAAAIARVVRERDSRGVIRMLHPTRGTFKGNLQEMVILREGERNA